MSVDAFVVMCNCYLSRILPNAESRRKERKKISKRRNINISFDRVISFEIRTYKQCHTNIESIMTDEYVESRKTDKCDYDILDSESELIEGRINVEARQFGSIGP